VSENIIHTAAMEIMETKIADIMTYNVAKETTYIIGVLGQAITVGTNT
jgi:hypothetical protein